MDRNKIVALSNAFYVHNKVDTRYTELIKHYCCVENNKNEKDVDNLIDVLLNIPPLYVNITDYCLDYYGHKHNLIKIEKLTPYNKTLKIY